MKTLEIERQLYYNGNPRACRGDQQWWCSTNTETIVPYHCPLHIALRPHCANIRRTFYESQHPTTKGGEVTVSWTSLRNDEHWVALGHMRMRCQVDRLIICHCNLTVANSDAMSLRSDQQGLIWSIQGLRTIPPVEYIYHWEVAQRETCIKVSEGFWLKIASRDI